ncbi:tRNA pseudouridine(38-40) synthase TruA [Halocatena pleomorpha]|uniref:tRNA pseudouridine synthase A n=1 Tax=Halocatena pleomorpha TaxID=1785090 RepID=A0A3P3RG33_9EURY|nr:tRNA pseudouridine(38-40) synthase TruA [Halocatena pleomorpha]RRJ31710.1 tRNA pseudouridine(38-40) synthase TruA [Halocatena pleomorpha]
MGHRAFRVAYDGSRYHGFQRQPDVPTVEGELFCALQALGVFDGDHRPTGYAAAGRTDRGVSAVAQTVSFDCPAWLSPRALNSELPSAIRAWASAEASPAFHATHDATHREYTYHLHAPNVALHRVRETLSALDGTHDFHNLTPDTDRTRRTLETKLETAGPYLRITLRASGFARQLVRRVVGLLTAVAHGDRDDVDRVLSAERLSGPDGVGAAPPEPLVLTHVEYPMLDFERDVQAAASATELFETKRIERETRSRVAGTIHRMIDEPPNYQ